MISYYTNIRIYSLPQHYAVEKNYRLTVLIFDFQQDDV